MFYSNVDQARIVMIACFSFLSFVFVIAINKDKNFQKLFGISFLTSLAFVLICIFYPQSTFQQTLLHHVERTFLIIMCLLILSWRWRNYYGSLILIITVPILFLFFIQYLKALPIILLSVYLQSGIILSLTSVTIIFLRKSIKEKELSLSWGLGLLGFCQLLQEMFPTQYLVLIVLSELLAYSLFFLYILKTTRDPYFAKLTKAEEKLADLNKTINYEVKKRIVEIERNNEHLLNLVQRDSLVDAYNKKGILNVLKEMTEDSRKQSFTILIFDIDNFKGVNDTKGHLAGDNILRKVSQIAKENIRGFDVLGRYGGDEFIIVLPGTTVPDAFYVADRFRKKVHSGSDVTVSIGIAAYPEDGVTIQKIIEVADAGLYESKRQGRNTVNYFTQSNQE